MNDAWHAHSACAFKKFLRLNCIKKASLKYSCPQIDISHEVLMIELAYFYLPQLENIFTPLGVAGKKWPFFHFLLEKSTLPPMMLWKRGATAYLLLRTPFLSLAY